MIPTASIELSLIQTDHHFQDLINSNCLMTSTNKLVEFQQLVAQMNNSWQQSNTSKQIANRLEINQTRQHTIQMQLLAFYWKNLNEQRKPILDELTSVKRRFH